MQHYAGEIPRLKRGGAGETYWRHTLHQTTGTWDGRWISRLYCLLFPPTPLTLATLTRFASPFLLLFHLFLRLEIYFTSITSICHSLSCFPLAKTPFHAQELDLTLFFFVWELDCIVWTSVSSFISRLQCVFLSLTPLHSTTAP